MSDQTNSIQASMGYVSPAQPQRPCPSCGHCPTCGRQNTWYPAPLLPATYPYQPAQPTWVSTGTATGTALNGLSGSNYTVTN